MAPLAAMFMLSPPLIPQLPTTTTTHNNLQPQPEPSLPVVRCHLPARSSSESSESSRSKFMLWLFGDPATYDKRFQRAIELSCS
uniref:At4g33666-like protein n=1 Tax=Brassica napus TaxID=3708 RepID=A0A068F4X7_BRANA|nr:At4g33666-like protein [Brassica napus]